MHLLYIGNEIRLEHTVRDAAAQFDANVELTVVPSGKGAILKVLGHERAYDYVVIDCGLSDVKCLAIIDLILKNQIVTPDRVCVIGLLFSKEDITSFNERNICVLKYTFDFHDLANHFRQLFAV